MDNSKKEKGNIREGWEEAFARLVEKEDLLDCEQISYSSWDDTEWEW